MLLDRTMNLPLCWKFCAVISLAINQQTSAPTRRHTCCLVMVIACGKKKKCAREKEKERDGEMSSTVLVKPVLTQLLHQISAIFSTQNLTEV